VKLLTVLLSYANVTILTNAESGWVQLATAKFMPAVVPLLERVKIISARSKFELHHPDTPLNQAPFKWKFYAFIDHFKSRNMLHASIQPKEKYNFISIGDSNVEREAFRAVTMGRLNVLSKNVKFVERPTIHALLSQQEVVLKVVHTLVHSDQNFDLQLTAFSAPSQPEIPTYKMPAQPPHSKVNQPDPAMVFDMDS